MTNIIEELEAEIVDVVDTKEVVKVFQAPAVQVQHKPAIKEQTQAQLIQATPTGDIKRDDFNYIRKNLKDVIDIGKSSLDELAEVAADSGHPRSYEALSILIKTIAESSRELIDLHGKMKELEEEKPENPGVTNNTLVLTTDEVIKMIKANVQKA